MPGNYTITARVDAESINASKYNADHQNHIDNLEPAKIDDYSTSVGQMQTSTDPGEAASESQATTLAGEIERLRFAIKETKGTTYWYQTPTASLAQVGQATIMLTNKTGGGLVAGDVVGLDEGNDNAVKLVDTTGTLWPMLVALGTIANEATGTFSRLAVSALVTGAVTRGHYLKKSATSKALVDTGTGVGHITSPPIGSVAVALDDAAGPGTATLAMLFWGQPETGAGDPPSFSAVKLGTNPASAGHLMLPTNADVRARNAANSADLQILSTDPQDRLNLGAGFGQTLVANQLRCDVSAAGRLVLPVGVDKYAT